MEAPRPNSLLLRALEGMMEASFVVLGHFFAALGWAFEQLSMPVGLLLCFSLIALAVRLMQAVISQPMQRRERARMFLALLESGMQGGRPVEQTIIELARRRERSMGVELHLLAAHLEKGQPLMAALERVPRLLPPAMLAMLRAGAASGDLRRVLPCCRALVREPAFNQQTWVHQLVTLGVVYLPMQFWWVALARVVVWPKFEAILKDMAGEEGGRLRLFDMNQVDCLWVGFVLFVCLPIMAVTAAHLAGPKAFQHLWPGKPDANGRFPDRWVERLRQRIELLLPWVRRRKQRDFSAMLTLLLDAGMPEAQAVQLAGESTANLVLAARARRVAEELARGVKLTEALRQMDDSGQLAWRLTNAAQGKTTFRTALAGWHDALDARATQQEQIAAHAIATASVLVNGLFVGLFAYVMFHSLITLVHVAGEW